MKDYFKCETGTWKYLPNWLRNIRENAKWIKWFIQRGSRGFADCDIWSIDFYISQIMPDMIERLRVTSHGHPAEMTEQQWNDILDKMQEGFLASRRIQNFEYGEDDYKKEYESDKRLFSEALDLFCKYYFDLWD